MRLVSYAARDGWGNRTVPFLESGGVAQAVEHVLAVAFGNKLCWFESHYRHFLYVALAVERVLVVAFGNKLCWFKSHYRRISLCNPGFWMRASSSLRKQNMLVWVPLSAYFFMYPYDWKHLLRGIVECASMMGVLGTQGGFALALFQGWSGGVKFCWKMCSSNFSFWKKFIIFLLCGLLQGNNTF